MPDQRPKVTVEDLLRLKRAERPDAAFWTGFERELRQKQLAALLEKRPWWQELPQLFARRAYLPVGATAILAFTLVSVKFYAPTQIVQAPVPVPANPVAAESEVAAPAPVSSPIVNRNEVTAQVEATQVAAAPAADEAVELMPLLVAPQASDRSSARLLAGDLDRLDRTQANFADEVLDRRINPSARVQTASVQTDELASVSTGQSRRSRLLAHYSDRQLAPEPSVPAIVRERLERRLGDSDASSRFSQREMSNFASPLPQIVALRF